MNDFESNFNRAFVDDNGFQGTAFSDSLGAADGGDVRGPRYSGTGLVNGDLTEGPVSAGDSSEDRGADSVVQRGLRAEDTGAESGHVEPFDALQAGPDPNLPVEEAFAELERLVKRMETEGISLEESFACYEKGIRLVRYCNEKIDRVEKKVRILRGEGSVTGENQM